MSVTMKDQEITMLREEIELLMRERDMLLRVAGSTAAFVAELDSRILPEMTVDAAELVAESLNALTDETLRDALESVRAHIEGMPTSAAAD
jgi:hypothetical protein